jgi:hypothetical protein
MEGMMYKESNAVESTTDIGKVNWVEIEMANNGYVVRYSVKESKPGSMEHCEWLSKSFVFSTEQEDEAFDLFKKMKLKSMKG